MGGDRIGRHLTCHNGIDKPQVKSIGEMLKTHGILPWLDKWELRPGLPWQPLLEEQIDKIKAAAVFIGKSGRGPWQDMELHAFLRKFVNREPQGAVIPVILPDCQSIPQLPTFLEGMTWVDFRKRDPDPVQRLLWGITGKNHIKARRGEAPCFPHTVPAQSTVLSLLVVSP